MKTITNFIRTATAVALLISPMLSLGQDTTRVEDGVKTRISNLRPYDQSGINVFEAPKEMNAPFDGLKVRFGAGFTQSFQNLKHENTFTIPANELYKMTPGFNTANANLYMDVQLADGIRLNLTSYLSSRHHNETWVKGGYIQFDKLPFKGDIWDMIMSFTTVKIGHMEINYGDQHFRRSDGGGTIYNPFVENYIMDQFATEIGGEVYVRLNSLTGMIGVSNGMIKGNIAELVPTTQDANIHKSPSFYFKGAFDKKLGDDLRLRLAASYYTNNSSGGNTLFGGDRTGSNYFLAMEKIGATTDANAFSGRFNPGFSKEIHAAQLNAFVKASGFELFGTYEFSNGRSKTETDNRDANQYAIEGVYRFGAKEKLFVGARYNKVDARLTGMTTDVSVDRTSFSAGWFLTRNVLLKAEYTDQNYNDFLASDYRNNGKFHGYVVQAVVGF
ncbi:hypothetical protein A5893_04760 [Pedobacter psychrophilus]|uniref:Porin n=1 Tax=Pedobacter psychrophilus TaxID=1826909 RepID=A0A179DH32_9SPHI|nr:hypothetical protein [Pedobacter psychrophilus]OAQ40268.1 hypothetical protein A5893_04760 [Pedobacter psychrophilus]